MGVVDAGINNRNDDAIALFAVPASADVVVVHAPLTAQQWVAAAACFASVWNFRVVGFWAAAGDNILETALL